MRFILRAISMYADRIRRFERIRPSIGVAKSGVTQRTPLSSIATRVGSFHNLISCYRGYLKDHGSFLSSSKFADITGANTFRYRYYARSVGSRVKFTQEDNRRRRRFDVARSSTPAESSCNGICATPSPPSTGGHVGRRRVTRTHSQMSCIALSTFCADSRSLTSSVWSSRSVWSMSSRFSCWHSSCTPYLEFAKELPSTTLTKITNVAYLPAGSEGSGCFVRRFNCMA
jgi:hypothetical protein